MSIQDHSGSGASFAGGGEIRQRRRTRGGRPANSVW